MKQQFKEYKEKSLSELNKILAEKRENLRELRFKVSQNQLKDVRAIRKLRNEISQILTLINKKRK